MLIKLLQRLATRISRRPPDFVIGGEARPYLLRWYVIPRNPVFNVYLHCFKRSDDDRALHDHPWANCSILLHGSYTEHTIAAGGVHRREVLRAGAVRLRCTGRIAHRVELHDDVIDMGGEAPPVIAPQPCWTLFITGPRYREWGFHCERGWIHWQRFTAADDPGAIGKGCEA